MCMLTGSGFFCLHAFSRNKRPESYSSKIQNRKKNHEQTLLLKIVSILIMGCQHFYTCLSQESCYLSKIFFLPHPLKKREVSLLCCFDFGCFNLAKFVLNVSLFTRPDRQFYRPEWILRIACDKVVEYIFDSLNIYMIR